MGREFLTPPSSHKTTEPVETAYFRAKQEWDDRLGRPVVQAKNWRMAFFLLGALSVILVITNLYHILTVRIEPVVITVNSETGQPKFMGKLDEQAYVPKEQEVKYFIGQFIQNVRAVPSDPVVIKQNWLTAYSFLKKEAATFLNELTNSDEDSPLKKIGKETVTIKPISVIRVNDSNSFQARWKELKFGENGQLEESYTMSAIFTVVFEKPKDLKVLQTNPLGIFIKNFQWNREL